MVLSQGGDDARVIWIGEGCDASEGHDVGLDAARRGGCEFYRLDCRKGRAVCGGSEVDGGMRLDGFSAAMRTR